MTELERVQEIMSVGEFNETEVEACGDVHDFKSWEYRMILHFTNEEYNFADPEMINRFEGLSDLNHETEKGFVYGFKQK